MICVPFYVIDDLYIDAYFMDKIDKPYLRILLVKVKIEGSKCDGRILNTIPFETVVELLRNGLSDLQNISFNIKKENISYLDIMLSSLYNPGYYFRKREKEMTLSSILKIYDLAYKNVLDKLNRVKDVAVSYLSLSLANSSVIINNNEDQVYTQFFRSDPKFREAILNALSER